jgi:hypothetical protein
MVWDVDLGTWVEDNEAITSTGDSGPAERASFAWIHGLPSTLDKDQ